MIKNTKNAKKKVEKFHTRIGPPFMAKISLGAPKQKSFYNYGLKWLKMA